MKQSRDESVVNHNLRVSGVVRGDLSIVVDGSSRLTVLNAVDVRWRRVRRGSMVTRTAWVAADTVIAESWSDVYIRVSLLAKWIRINRKFLWCQCVKAYRVLRVNVGVLVLITRCNVASRRSVVRSTKSAAYTSTAIRGTTVIASIVGNRVEDGCLLSQVLLVQSASFKNIISALDLQQKVTDFATQQSLLHFVVDERYKIH